MEPTPNTIPSLFWAYTVIWTVLVVYIFSLTKRLNKLEEKVVDTEDK